MLVYNITTKVEKEIEVSWLQWQKEEHIPEVMASGMFNDFKIYQLISQPEDDGITFIIQYFAETFANYQEYSQNFAPLLIEKAFNKWGDKFLSFKSLLQAVQ